MKPLSYYKTTSVSIPRKDDYMTIYYYRKGVMVGMKKQFDDDFTPPKNCVEEQVLDEISYEAHLKHYHQENLRLQEEFRKDLLAKYNMTNHPKGNYCFDKAWDFGIGSSLWDVEDYFMSLIEVFKNDIISNDVMSSGTSNIFFGYDHVSSNKSSPVNVFDNFIIH